MNETSHHLVVTTSVHATPELISEAQRQASELNAVYWRRRSVTVNAIVAETGCRQLFIVKPDGWRLIDIETGTLYRFHPNLALIRGLNLARGQRDLFAEATDLKAGDSYLDCTLGFAAEATLASYLVGTGGSVVGLESVPELAAITRNGVASFELQTAFLTEALRRIHVVTADYRLYLPACSDNSVTVVYFDPFFEEQLAGSEPSIGPLAFFGNHAPLDTASVNEALRVASRCVVVKHPRDTRLADKIEACVSHRVFNRKGRVVYSVLPTNTDEL